MSDRLFRKVALDRLSSPEQIDRLARVTTPRAWLALAGLAGLLLAALVWGIFGTFPITVSGAGVIVRGDGIQLVRAPMTAQVKAIKVAIGDKVKAGDPVIELIDSTSNLTKSITAVDAGRVLEIRAAVGDMVVATQPLVSLEAASGDLNLVLYLLPADAQKLAVGKEVQITPQGIAREEFGYLKGTVKSIGRFPVTMPGLMRVVGSDDLAKAFSEPSSPIEVRVELMKAGDQADTFQWSSPRTPPADRIASGTLCSATVILREQRPISLILGN